MKTIDLFFVFLILDLLFFYPQSDLLHCSLLEPNFESTVNFILNIFLINIKLFYIFLQLPRNVLDVRIQLPYYGKLLLRQLASNRRFLFLLQLINFSF